MRPLVPLALVLLGSAGCGEDTYIVVTVQSRQAVHDPTRLKVSLNNAGTMRTDELELGATPFPVTFSISAPGRSGELTIQVDAIDANDFLVGRGAATSTVETATANVMLDSADFVINTDFAEDQFPSDDYEAHGFQVAAGTDGTWTVAYRDRCAAVTGCNMYARRFDAAGRPVTSKIAAGTNGFPISTKLTTGLATPAIAAAGTTTLEVWDFDEPSPSTISGVACRALDAMGGGVNTSQSVIAADTSPDVVSITPLSNSNFAVTWNFFNMSDLIRAAIVKPDCTVANAAVNVSTVTTGLGARRGAVAASGSPSKIMYAWILDGAVRVRIADNTNTFSTVDSEFLPKTATEQVEFVRVAPLGTGFAVLVRWALITGSTGPGRIELYRTNQMGAVLGQPVLVSNRSGSDFASSEAFGVATSASGTLFVTWHACLDNGDGSGCGVFGRAFKSDGNAVGPEITIPTTTTGDQTNPSVAALGDAFAVVWKDESGGQPDPSGSSVRGRIVYPDGASGN